MTAKAVALTANPPAATAGSAADVWASPQHAFLQMFEPKHVKKGNPELGSPQGRIDFQFNPKEVTITKSAKWERHPSTGKKSGPPEYSGAEPCKMTLELFFDSTMDPKLDVVAAVEKLFSCCVPCKEPKKGDKPMPFLVKFNWGSVESFAAFVSQVQAKYTRFGPDGVPIRAVCTVNLEEIDVTPTSGQNPTSGTASADRVRTLVSGDSLALVAYQEYGDPQLWRPLAAYNRIDDPMRIPDGTRLLLPVPDTLFAVAV